MGSLNLELETESHNCKLVLSAGASRLSLSSFVAVSALESNAELERTVKVKSW